MPVTTAKITDIVAARVGAARQLVGTRIIPIAVPAGRKAASRARQVVGERIMPTVGPVGRKATTQARELIGERIMPAVGTALVVSAPIRGEALRRGRLAVAALRNGEGMAVKKRRRWPVALVCLGLGGALGATAAWLSQAGKPVQLTPYPLTTNDIDDETDLHSMNGSQPLDLTDDSPAHHPA